MVLEDWGRRMRGLLAIVAVLFSVLLLRLFHLQITTAADYAKESEDNRIAQKRLKAPRGLILDRDGEVLARNRASYSIMFTRGSRESDAEAVAAVEEALDTEVRYHRRSRNIRLLRDVDIETVAIVAERLQDDWALSVEIEPQRDYPYSELVSHLVGYLGELQETELANPGTKRYVVGDYVGKTGVEKVYEDSLRGIDGVSYIEVDARHRLKHEHPFPDRERSYIPGSDIRLTLDLDIQRAAMEALPDSLAGSVVALNAQTGAILALVSKPSFDPNAFVSYRAQEERRQLVQDEARPLLNRATQGSYPPGSTLKMVGAVAALEMGITDTLSTFEACAGSLQIGDVVFRCNNREGHGELNLLQAVETSCNIYFNHLAQILGMEAWWSCADRLGFGHSTGVDLLPEEREGLLPTRRYYREREGWVTGHLMNLVIGQGAMLVNPLQMARYVAALGNGGYLVIPHVVGPAPDLLTVEGLSENTLAIVRTAMRRVVYGEQGTGRRVAVEGLDVAGKSGTAQGPREGNDAWFIAFAPTEHPEIAVAVVVEGGGGGGSVAGPVTRKVLEAYRDDRNRRRPKMARAELGGGD
ncbi:MAG: penicillin-binding protein 2 [Candidatus Latescibacterota bacterium]|nr:penicillin-binding protein 2 [Candidatus Latescibacterota bacterium]